MKTISSKILGPIAAGALAALLSPNLFAQPFAYIANSADETVTLVDTATNTVVDTLDLGIDSFAVESHPNGGTVYMTDTSTGGGEVAVVDTSTQTVIKEVLIGNTPTGMSLNPAGTRLYVASTLFLACQFADLTVIDTSTNTVVDTLSLPSCTFTAGLDVSPDGNTIYLATDSGFGGFGQLYVIDVDTLTVTDTVALGAFPTGVAVHPDGSVVYVTIADDDTLEVVDTGTHAIVATVPVGTAPQAVTVHPNGERVYVSNSFGTSVSVIDAAANTVVSTVVTGIGPLGIQVHPDGDRVYVANQFSNDLAVIDVATNSVTDVIPTGALPTSFGNFIAPLPEPHGGTVSGQSLNAVICVNRTTRQRVVAEIGADGKSWDCEAAGLGVSPGDRVHTLLIGEAS